MKNDSWLEDQYVKIWFGKKSEKTVKNYRSFFPKWLEFIGMTPTEQIQKRLKDLQSTNKIEREFFEEKIVQFKNFLQTQYDTEASIKAHLTTVRSFFSSNRLALSLSREDVKIEVANKIVSQEWIPANEEIRVIYSQASPRDRALLLVLYQSGFSEKDVEALNIEHLNNVYEHEGHLYISKKREKTNIVQSTCISVEAIHDIRAMLRERNNPTEGALFVSPKGERLNVRFINEAMKRVTEKAFPNKDFKTKSLRDSYNSALLRANLTAEVKDIMFGHKRRGARHHYAYDQTTIVEAYQKAFKYLTINHGTQARQDLSRIEQTVTTLSEILAKQQTQITELRESMNTFLHNLEGGLVYEAYRENGTSDYYLLESKKIDKKTARKLLEEEDQET